MELRDYFRGLRRHWLAIILMTLLGVGAAYGWVLLQTPVYEATASALVQGKVADAEGVLISNDNAARAKVPTYLDMAGWKQVAEHAIDELGLSTSPESVAARVTVENPTNTSIMYAMHQYVNSVSRSADGGGTFNLITKRVDLGGTVATDATLSEAAGGGIKSFLLKPLNVFFRDKKKNTGAVLPVSITAVVLRIIFELKLADIVITVTAGAPGGATDSVTSFIYREYRDRSNVGYGTALAEFYLVVIIIFMTLLLWLTNKWMRRFT